jgi:hypothetical protein
VPQKTTVTVEEFHGEFRVITRYPDGSSSMTITNKDRLIPEIIAALKKAGPKSDSVELVASETLKADLKNLGHLL